MVQGKELNEVSLEKSPQVLRILVLFHFSGKFLCLRIYNRAETQKIHPLFSH